MQRTACLHVVVIVIVVRATAAATAAVSAVAAADSGDNLGNPPFLVLSTINVTVFQYVS